MSRPRNDILQGTLALLVLRSLAAQGRMHGYAITATSSGSPTTCSGWRRAPSYPALHRMEQAGWVKAEWGMTEKNREARFYA